MHKFGLPFCRLYLQSFIFCICFLELKFLLFWLIPSKHPRSPSFESQCFCIFKSWLHFCKMQIFEVPRHCFLLLLFFLFCYFYLEGLLLKPLQVVRSQIHHETNIVTSCLASKVLISGLSVPYSIYSTVLLKWEYIIPSTRRDPQVFLIF